MPTESPRQPRQLVAMGFVLVAIATSATELALASPGQAVLPGLTASLCALGWALVIFTYLKARAARESSPSLSTMSVALLLMAASWGLDIARVLATTERLSPELLMVVLLRAATLTFAALAGNAVCLRITGGLSVALMLFASVLTERRAIYGLMFVYALLGSYWLILLYWSQIQVRLLEGRSKRPPVLAMAAGGLITGSLIIAVAGPRQTIGVLAEWLGTSGGTSRASPDARSGVGDGQDLASGTESARSSGPVESDIFLETREQSLYDASNEKWGEPEKPRKREQALAVAVLNQAGEPREEKSKQPNPAREFSVVRKRRRDRSAPSTVRADAAYFVKGKTPLHIRLVAFDRFDGRRWIEPATGRESEGLRLGFGGWILLPGLPASVAAGDLSHRIVVGSMDAPQVPLPSYAHRFRIDLVDRPDFFRFSQPGILIYRTNTALPRQTVLDTASQTIDPVGLRSLSFPPGRSYALPAFLSPAGAGTDSSEATSGDSGSSLGPRILELASSWTRNTERGWQQVDAIVARLRESYVYEPEAEMLPDTPDPMIGFLFEQRRGSDYAFATAACLLLRSLGYPCRFVEGLYADPRRFDRGTQQTPVRMPGDLHTWAEVMLPGGGWVVIEPTPGFEVLGPERGLLAQFVGLATRLIGMLRDHPLLGITLALVIVASIRSWRSIGMVIATCAWRLEFRGAPRERILATVRLLERRARLAGRRRPPGVTLRRWYHAVSTPGTDDASRHALYGFLGMAEWALYGRPNEPEIPGRSDQDVAAVCREFVRMWPATRLSPRSKEPTPQTRRHVARTILVSRAVFLAAVTSLPVAAGGRAVAQDTDRAPAGMSVAKGQLPDLPESVWADPAPAATEANTRRPPIDVKARSHRTGLSGVAGVEDIPEMSLAERINEISMQLFTALFFFAIGASIGSFLNVVVYRLPRGMRLWGRKSHCPLCQVDLSFRENMPIIGWLRLRGRCLACQAPISIRYPAVEAIVGLVFLLLLQVELLSGGKSIPIRVPNAYAGVVWIIWYPKWDLIGLYLYHCVLLCTALCIALIREDGQPVPRSLILAAAIVGILCPVAMPSLHPVPAVSSGPAWLPDRGFRSGALITAAAGGAAGVCLAGLILRAGPAGRPAAEWRGFAASLGLAGTFLGWQAAISIATLMTMVYFVYASTWMHPVRARDRSLTTFAAAATLVQITLWRALSAPAFWPSHTSGPGLIGIYVLLIGLLNVGARLLRRRSLAEITGRTPSFSAEDSNAM
jgi:protein-glutamine gamma-glutamyltransferase